jgi:NADPH:quinone reductase-like Zn-dependent oxidoreductase
MDGSQRPLLSARWAGVVDTVGGPMLASLLRSIKNEGCVAACGLVGGSDLSTTVYPFILRGLTLRGIDSAWCPMPRRRHIWDLLAGPWKPDGLDQITTTIDLEGLANTIEQLRTASHVGRTIVDVRHGGNRNA